MRQQAGGLPLAARFTLNPLADGAWADVADRLARKGIAIVRPSRLPIGGKNRYQVADVAAAKVLSSRLARALLDGTVDPLQRTLVAVGWASGSFDDLFKVHGVTVSPRLTTAARDLVNGDKLAAHLEAACAYSNSMLDLYTGPT